MDSHISNAKTAIETEINALKRGIENLNDDFNKSIELILQRIPPGKLIVMGVGKSGHIGKKISATLASTGTPSFFVHPAEAGHGDLGMLSKGDLVLAISQSGESSEIVNILPYLKRHNIELIAMTGNAKAKLGLAANYVLNTSVIEEACPLDLAPTASTTLALALGDALAIALLKSRGFTKIDFAITHPLGILGRQLTIRVCDIMSNLEHTPVANENTLIKDSLMIMSKCGLGFIIIKDKNDLKGIFTDGDLRRCLESGIDITNTPLSKVMSSNFHLINEDEYAVDAITLMEKNKISSLPVINNLGHLSGAINMRQLLQSGVI